VKFAVITARDDDLELLEGFFYFGGLIGILVGGLGLAAFVAARRRGWLQLAWARLDDAATRG
jgi:hypothetical protein